jgi:hypothetical protein
MRRSGSIMRGRFRASSMLRYLDRLYRHVNMMRFWCEAGLTLPPEFHWILVTAAAAAAVEAIVDVTISRA